LPKFHKRWTVLPHGRVETVDEGILTVVGEISMPLAKFPRRMTVVRLSRNRTAIFSAMALKETAMRRVEELGKPAFLIVPNGHHRLDARIWKQRYPGIKVLCPPAARKKVAEVVPVDGTEDTLRDKAVDFVVLGGTGGAEAALVVRRKSGTTLVLNDIIANVRRPRSFGTKVIVRLFGFGLRRPQVPWVVKRAMVKHRRALATQFEAWGGVDDLRRIIVSHGDTIDREPSATLRSLAGDLSR
jgi:hypothetical protein